MKAQFLEGKWIDAEALTYKMLTGNTRTMEEHQEVRYQHKVEEEILSLLEMRPSDDEADGQKFLLLIGPSLAGKTHLSIKIIKKIDKEFGKTVVLVPHSSALTSSTKEELRFPEPPFDAQCKIVLLDDFQEFFKTGKDIDPGFFYRVAKAGWFLWANCLNLDEEKVIDERMSNNVNEYFKRLYMAQDPKDLLSTEEGERLATRQGRRLNKHFNGLVGHIYCDPLAVKRKYEALHKNEKDMLDRIKQAYLLGAFDPPNIMSTHFIRRIYRKEIQSTNYNKLNLLLANLESKGFLKRGLTSDYYHFDVVWLNAIVSPDLVNHKDFYSWWNDKEDVLITRNVVQYTNDMSNEGDYETVLRIYNEMLQNQITPNNYTYNVLINKSPNYEIALDWLEKMGRRNMNAYTIGALIKLSKNRKQALEWFYLLNPKPFSGNERNEDELYTWYYRCGLETANAFVLSSFMLKLKYKEMKQLFEDAGEKANHVRVFNVLIQNAPDADVAMSWYDKLGKELADVSTYHHLMLKFTDYSCMKYWFKECGRSRANVYIYNRLIQCSPDYTVALRWYKRLGSENADAATFSSLMEKNGNYEEMKNIWQEQQVEKRLQKRVLVGVINTLIKYAGSMSEAEIWFDWLGEEYADIYTFNEMIALSVDYKEAKRWFREELADAYTYTLLMKKTDNYDEKVCLFNQFGAENANTVMYNMLIASSRNYKESLDWFTRLGDEKADVYTYNALIFKSPDNKAAARWLKKLSIDEMDVKAKNRMVRLSEMYEEKKKWYETLKAGSRYTLSYNEMIHSCRSYDTALQFFSEMVEYKVGIDNYTYNYLIGLSPNLSVAEKWLSEMEANRCLIDEYTYGYLMQVASRSTNVDAYQVAISLHDEMLERGIRSNVQLFTFLISLAPDFEQAMKLLRVMVSFKDKKGHRIIPNEKTVKTLFQKAISKENNEVLDAWLNEHAIFLVD
ncbi:pentatricopeptide repeat-containing protein [Roseimarinus sediminis]|uniref:hypothetical protein n=1 Tax=Roseimarinus sediminis TaxID=1610899 RepID=UPI003D1EEA24